ncbi:MAG TPA: SdrD B-like domain-containing protein [Methanothrix sp.]|nr:SdrD B-like domain-containing protein [Methanothrix sp.]
MSDLVSDKTSPQMTDSTIVWTAAATDAESDPLQYQFALDGTVAQDWSDSATWSWTATSEQVGSHVIEVKVRDGKHSLQGDSSKSAPFEIVLPPNNAPALSDLVSDKTSPQMTGSTIVWTAAAADAESDPISYRFLVNGSPVSDWQAESQWSWTATQPGTSEIAVQVKDDHHDSAEGEGSNLSREFTIVAPQPEVKPEVEQPIVTGNEVTENETVPEENATAPVVENVTVVEPVNETGAETPSPETVEPPLAENITTPIVAENVTVEAPVNETGAETPSPETVEPPLAENITTPIVAENETVVQPANETEAAKPAPVAVNQTPVLNSLTSDVASPQVPGTTITWTADATDADSDPLLFRFMYSGPATGNAWQTAADWSESNVWTWKTTTADTGESQIKVQIRDGKHAAEDGFDSEAAAFFTIKEPVMNISGRAFDDQNTNGAVDSGENGLSGWTVNLKKPDGSEVSALTSEDGSYRFEQLAAGSYTVGIVAPSGWKAISPESGSLNVDLSGSDASDRNFAMLLSSFRISGMKYNDLDGNGANDGEPGMEGWTIQLSRDGSVIKSATTAKDGSYQFENLDPGTYTLSEVDQSGWQRTAPSEATYSVTLSDADVSGQDFGNHGSWSISGSSYYDQNGNGVRDGDETGQAGWSIQLSSDGSVINTTTTGQDGTYSFRNLAPGRYTLTEVSQDGWTISQPNEGSYSVDLSGADATGQDFGNRGSFTISGVKFYDANENGVQDSDEPSIPGQPVTLVKDGVEIANITSADDGSYSFANLAPGTYEVDDPIVVSITTSSVVVAPISVLGKSTISGVNFNDLNGNGLKDTGEPGIANWQMVLTYVGPLGGPVHDIVLAKTKTDASGAYSFKNLFPGVYEISELSQQGWVLKTDEKIQVSVPGSKSNVNFGNKLESAPGKCSVWGVKYNDLDGDGVNDGEPGLSGWTIKIKNLATNAEQTATTNANGWYSFLNLDPGNYQVSETLKSGWTATSPTGGVSAPFALVAGDNKQMDFGNKNNNLPPSGLVLTASPASPQRAGKIIKLKATATDSENDPLQYRFLVRGPSSNQVREDTGYSSNNAWSWNTAGYVAGDYQIEAWVIDGKHSDANGFDAKKSAAYKLTVANLPPRIDVMYADRPAPQYAGSWVKWTAVATDPEGDSLRYKFYLRGPSTNGFWIDQTGWTKNNRWIWRTNTLDVGYSEVLVAVRDGSHAGPGGSDDYQIAGYSVINLNLPPIILGLASSVNSPQPVGATVWWNAYASDPEGNTMFFRYWVKGPATNGRWALARDWSTDPTWFWMTSVADAGTSQIQVQVRDGMHSSPGGYDDDAGALFTVQLPNQPPTLISLKPDLASSQTAGKTIKWTAIATDPDREPVYYKFWLKGPSTGNAWKAVQDWSTRNQWTWTSSGYDGGAYTVYVYARDGRHNPDTGFDSALGAPYLLAANPAPTLTSLTPDKKSPQVAGKAVKWTAKATDGNRDPVLYRFWLKGPSTGNAWKVVQDWSVSNQWTWTSSGYDSGAYSVYVYVRDGAHSPATGYDSAMGAQYQLTVNDPPVLSALSPDKASPQTAGTTVKWTAIATDAQRDPIYYQFWLKGPSTANAWKVVQDWSSKNQWTMKGISSAAGSYRVFVYVRDALHAPATAYDSAVGQDYQLLSAVAAKKVVVIGGRV